MAGVFCKEQWSDVPVGLLDSLWTFLLLSLLTCVLYPLRRHAWRWCFGCSLMGCCWVGGWLSLNLFLQQVTYAYPEKAAVYRVRLLEDGQPKSRSLFFPAWVESRRDSLQEVPVARKVHLYFESDSAASCLRAGEELWVNTRLSLSSGGANFDAFDYGRYLLHRGISASGYVSGTAWQRTGNRDLPSFRARANACRQRLVSLYREWGFPDDERAVLAALTVGEKSELSDSLQESYSVAGASHVLALSGLHIGLLYWLLQAILLRLLARGGNAGRWLRLGLLLGALWAYAYLTGLSPSVVRSVCLFSLVGIAELCSRRSLTLHSLGVVAWLMVLVRPTWLFDVGFQLSFAAVAAILLLQPVLAKSLLSLPPFGRWVGSLLTVSLAAQLGTAPLVLYYFSRFSTHFLLTNLVVIPVVTLILYLALLMLVLTPLPLLQGVVVWVVRALLQALNQFVRWVEQWPGASMDGIWLDAWEVVALYLLWALTGSFIRQRSGRRLLLLLAVTGGVWTAHQYTVWQHRPRCSLVFYRCERCPVVHCIEADGRSWLHTPASVPDREALQRAAGNYWKHLRLAPPVWVSSAAADTLTARRRQLLTFHGCRVALVSDNRWRHCSSPAPLPVRYLYLCRGFTRPLDELLAVFAPECVVLDASLSDERCARYIQACRQHHLPFLSLKEKGSVCFLL